MSAANSLTAHPLDRPASPAKATRSRRASDLALYLLLALLVAAAWFVSRAGWFDEDSSYWLAVAGGSMMLVLFLYPLRKYARFMRRLGKVKWWFWLHLALGVGGPWLILVHSNFHIGSLNAGVALYSMLTVVASGVIGRFIHVRVHRGLNGEITSLARLRESAGLVESEARSKLHFAPLVEARLLAFEQRELQAAAGWPTHLRRVFVLPLECWFARGRCEADLQARLRELAPAMRWSDAEVKRRERRARRLIERYLEAVVRVAQYTAYERLFALWHVAHLPFVYLLVISAVVHVVAVHAY